MSFLPPRPPDRPSPLAEQVQQMQKTLQSSDPHILAERTGATYYPSVPGQGELKIDLLGRTITITFPGFEVLDPSTGKAPGVDVQAMLLYHLVTSQGRPPTGRWVSFAELPDGRFYHQAFQGYTGQELVRAFGFDQLAFEAACIASGGERQKVGDASFIFQALPRVPLMLVYWQGDEDFPPSVQVLFDASVADHLPTDVCAILGSMLARRVKKAKGSA